MLTDGDESVTMEAGGTLHRSRGKLEIGLAQRLAGDMWRGIFTEVAPNPYGCWLKSGCGVAAVVAGVQLGRRWW
jgi:hypothetical protein